MEQNLLELVKRLEVATQKLENLAAAGSGTAINTVATGSAPTTTATATFVAAFDELTSNHLTPMIDKATQIGGLVSDQAQLFNSAVKAQRQLLEIASKSKKPDTNALQNLLKPMQESIGKIIELKDKNRPSPFFNHLSAIADGIGALGWVVVEPTPAPYIAEMKESAQFYANRVIKEYKDKDKLHVDYVQSYSTFLTELQAYVKKYHTTGLSWNPKGGDASSAPVAQAEAPAPKPAAPAMNNASLFGALNKDNLTAALRKVDKSEMTHKNPELRASGVVKATESNRTETESSAKKITVPSAKPTLALHGNKWVVENFTNDQSLVIDKAELKHVVYIYNCTGCTIQVKGKVNAVTIDTCKKTGTVVENVVSTVEVVNCKSTQVQITGVAPTVLVDKTESLQLYVSKESIGMELFTAKSSAVNVLFPDATGDFVEKPVSEQLKTTIVNGKLETVAVEHKG